MEKYQDKVNKTPDCHIWIGSINPYGYGIIFINGKHKQAHRIAFEARYGIIPKGMVINHLCRVRNCVNPDHLEIATHKTNILSGLSPSAINSLKTHCSNGHEFTEENTKITSRGWRECRACVWNRWHKS